MKILVVDDMAVRYESMQDAADLINESGDVADDQQIETRHVTNVNSLVTRLSVEDLADFDVAFVDFNLGSERAGMIVPDVPIAVGQTVVEMPMSTGLGVIQYLRTAARDERYLATRAGRPPVRLYGFTNVDDGALYQLFVSATFAWTGVPPFEPILGRPDVLGPLLLDLDLWDRSRHVSRARRGTRYFSTFVDYVRGSGMDWGGIDETLYWMRIYIESLSVGADVESLVHCANKAVDRGWSTSPRSRWGLNTWSTAEWGTRLAGLGDAFARFVSDVEGQEVTLDLRESARGTQNFWLADDVRVALEAYRLSHAD